MSTDRVITRREFVKRFRAAAIAPTFVSVGDKSPLSSWETCVGCPPLSWANVACVNPALVLAAAWSSPDWPSASPLAR